MSADAKILDALLTKTKKELRYFELVKIALEVSTARGLEDSSTRKVYFCVGKHAIFFVKSNLSKLIKGCHIEYKWLEKVVEDTKNTMHFMLVFNQDRGPECPEKVLVMSENRASLLNRMAVCFLADGMLRTGKTVSFPRFELNLQTTSEARNVNPFQDYRAVTFHDYRFFLRRDFKDLPNAVARKFTGAYSAPASVLFNGPGGQDEKGEIELHLHVYDPVPLDQLDQIGRNHIRWVAMEYKQGLVQRQQTYVIKSQLYLKKMNLSDDMAAWVCWELMLKAPDVVTVVIVMRRQYVPPLMDSVQDFAFIMKCPAQLIDSEKIKQEDLLHECRLCVDTFGPLAQRISLYTEIIQAKLDALLFDEDAMGWIRCRLRLKPDGKIQLEMSALIFVKGIIRILSDENALSDPDLHDHVTNRASMLAGQRGQARIGLDTNPIVVATQLLRTPLEGLPLEGGEEDDHITVCKNAWHARVARYLSWCVDGGLLGSRFTLAEVINAMKDGAVTQEADKKLEAILTFLVHVRPKDLSKPWDGKQLKNQLISPMFMDCTFNDRVMQVLLEMGYISRLLPPRPGEGSMSVQYAQLLTNLCMSGSSSMNLKASICRQIIAGEKRDADRGDVLCPGMMHLMRSGGLFLATYATAALVNLSQAKEAVKNHLMNAGISQVILQQLKSKDDDLILYTLVLLIHHTKSVHYRLALKNINILNELVDLLFNFYQNIKVKQRVLTELCGVIGQMCNDEETRQFVCDTWAMVIDCLLWVFDNSSAGTNLQSKVLFAFKQLCANSAENKEQVGQRVIKSVVESLANVSYLKNKDWATNAVMLLQLLAISRQACKLMHECAWNKAYQALSASPLGIMDATRERIQSIKVRVEQASNEDGKKNKHPAGGGQKRIDAQ